MFRSRSLLVLFRERRKVLIAQRQVVRYGALQCQKVSKRRLSDSVKVLNQRKEFEDRDKKTGVGKSSRQKLFPLDVIDDIFEEEGKVTTNEKQHKGEDKSEQKENEAVLKKIKLINSMDNQNEFFDALESCFNRKLSLDSKKVSKRRLSDSVKVLNQRKEFEDRDKKTGVGKSSRQKLFPLDVIDDIFEEEGKVTTNEKQHKGEDKSEQKENEAVLKKIKLINSMDNQNELFDALESCFNRKLSLDSKKVSKRRLSDSVKVLNQRKEFEDRDKKTGVGKSSRQKLFPLDVIDDIFEEEGKVTTNEKQHKGEDKSEQKENEAVLKKIKLINSMDNQNELFDALESCFNRKLSLDSKNEMIITVLNNLEKLDVTDLDEKYVKALENHVKHNSQITRFRIRHLLKILDFCLKGSSEDNDLIFQLLHELCQRFRKLKWTLLILETLKGRQSTDKRREVYEMGKKRLLVLFNIGNVTSPQELLSVMSHLMDNKEAQMRMEEEASIMLHSMDSVQTSRLIYLLALNKSKNMALVANARKQLSSRPINLDMIDLQKLFYACGILRIKDPDFLGKVSMNMLDILENDACFDINICWSVLWACSSIGWNFKSLTTEIMKKLREDIDSCLQDQDLLHLVYLVRSLCRLNLVEYGDLGLKIVEHLVSKQIRQSHMLKVVLSMAFIQKAETGSVVELLQPAFYQPMLDEMKDQPADLQDKAKRKLLNLYGYLKEDLHETVPGIESQATEWRNQLQEKMHSPPIVGLARDVSKVLNAIAPLEKYTNTSIVTKYGYQIDFEIFVDKHLNVVRLDNAEGVQKVWIKMLDYRGFIHGGQEPEYSGDTAMMLRHLKSEQGAIIVYVPYFDWSYSKMENRLYLVAKIKTAMEPAV